MEELSCDWCDAPADIVDNYDTLLCWECWDEAGRDKPHNLIFRVLRNRDGSSPGTRHAIDETAGRYDTPGQALFARTIAEDVAENRRIGHPVRSEPDMGVWRWSEE